jgi:hypothetical protein
MPTEARALVPVQHALRKLRHLQAAETSKISWTVLSASLHGIAIIGNAMGQHELWRPAPIPHLRRSTVRHVLHTGVQALQSSSHSTNAKRIASQIMPGCLRASWNTAKCVDWIN